MESEVARVPPTPPPQADEMNAGAYMMELSYLLGSIRLAYISEMTTPSEAQDKTFDESVLSGIAFING